MPAAVRIPAVQAYFSIGHRKECQTLPGIDSTAPRHGNCPYRQVVQAPMPLFIPHRRAPWHILQRPCPAPSAGSLRRRRLQSLLDHSLKQSVLEHWYYLAMTPADRLELRICICDESCRRVHLPATMLFPQERSQQLLGLNCSLGPLLVGTVAFHKVAFGEADVATKQDHPPPGSSIA